MKNAPKKSTKRYEKLEYLRKIYGYSQEDFATLIGTSKSNYSHKVNKNVPFKFEEEVLIIWEVLNKKAIQCGDKALTINDIFMP